MRKLITYMITVAAALIIVAPTAAYVQAARVRHHVRHHVHHVKRRRWLPPHHLLWGCIHDHEGPWDDKTGPHAGGLQMTIGWEGLVRNAGYLPRRRQEWIAEQAFRENDYHTSFLYQQWFNWDGAAGACLKYAY